MAYDFHWWVHSVLPLVFDNSLSYYEVLTKLTSHVSGLTEDVKKITEIIDNIEQIEDIEEFIELLNSINAEIGDITSLDTDTKESLVAAINELKDNIGNLSELDTPDTDSLVNAINDVLAGVYGKYTLPEGGIPEDDLSQTVKTKLDKVSIDNYSQLNGKPSINGNELRSGNNTLQELGIGNYNIPSDGIPENDLNEELKAKIDSATEESTSIASKFNDVAPQLDSFVATEEHEAGELVYIDDKLYKFTRLTLVGERLRVGNQIVETTISKEIENANIDLSRINETSNFNSFVVNGEATLPHSTDVRVTLIDGVNCMGGSEYDSPYLITFRGIGYQPGMASKVVIKIFDHLNQLVYRHPDVTVSELRNTNSIIFEPETTDTYHITAEFDGSFEANYKVIMTIAYTTSQGITAIVNMLNAVSGLPDTVQACRALVEQNQQDMQDFEDNVSELQSALDQCIEIENINTGLEPVTFSHGYFVTSNDSVDLSDLHDNATWLHSIIDCKSGDIFTVNLQSASSSVQAVCFIDASSAVLSRKTGLLTNEIIVAPKNANKCILQTVVSGLCWKGIPIKEIHNFNVDGIAEDLLYKKYMFTKGYIALDTSQVDIESINDNASYAHTIADCEAGDIFFVTTGSSSSTAKAWAFLDSSNNKIKEVSGNVLLEDEILFAPQNAKKLVINTTVASTSGKCVKGINYKNYQFTKTIGQYIPMAHGFITTNTNPININNVTPNATIRYAVVDCVAGDKFLLNTTGASTAAYSYTFINSSGNPLEYKSAGLDNYIAVAPTDSSKLIIHSFSDTMCMKLSGALSKYIFSKDNYVNGKQVLIYQFGGLGNDWCFVRTPTGYDPSRKRPYPFVICNHGNGWEMNGTIQKANWTKRTMYVPLSDPDYQSDPTEYNGTSDESLWYSNPTIEALLTAGYIVCGCENYGDGLYGNNNCRNACVDFFYHMIKTYNVEDRCYMIGASNGAMTSLNAAYLLQGQVKAMILQYPLTCLVNQYEHYPNHRASIRAAYGITDSDITIAELTKAVATHDPLTVDVVGGTKVGVFPPTKLYYSPDDAVVDCQYNALALANMLDNSNKVVETVECSGEHGDHTHFAPADYVAWFDAN